MLVQGRALESVAHITPHLSLQRRKPICFLLEVFALPLIHLLLSNDKSMLSSKSTSPLVLTKREICLYLRLEVDCLIE